jgi:hypothetical protein
MTMNKIFAIALALPLFAGGFYLELGSPSASSDPKAKGAVVLARFTGCHEPEKASLIATAEGMVAGKRQSIPLQAVALSTPGVYAITKQWPAEGKWVLKLVGRYPVGPGVTTTLVRLAGDGYDRGNMVMKAGAVDTNALESMLQ